MTEINNAVNKDHDMLIALNTKMSIICESQNRIEKHLLAGDEHCRICKQDLGERINKKIGWSQFKWIFSGTAALMIAAMFWFGNMSYSHQSKLKEAVREFEDHAAFATLAWEELTGQKWGMASREELQAARENYKRVRELSLKKQNGKKTN